MEGEGIFYNLDYGFGVNLSENITVVFFSDQIHGSTVLSDDLSLHTISQSVTLSTLAALQRYDIYIAPHTLKLQCALGVA